MSAVMSNFSFSYGDERIHAIRVPSVSNSEKLKIKVYPDCRVEVFAPVHIDDGLMLAAVKKRSRWIYKKLQYFREQSEYKTARQYISGESHYYLGKQYLLKVVELDHHAIESVKLRRGRLDINTRQKDPAHVKKLLAEWYRSRAREVFARRLDAMLEQALWVDSKPVLGILSMKTQWGSCSARGKLSLNPSLVKAPRDCIDYVILHELCHLAEHNHSRAFYKLMCQVMPGWRKIKILLDGMANSLICL